MEEAKREFWSAKLSDWALVGFNGLLVLYTFRLWKSTEKLWKAGESQIKLAGRSADIAQASLVKLERAFVFPKDFAVNWRWYLDNENKFWWSIRPIFENAGSSATVDMTTNLNFALLDNPIPPNFSFPLAADTHNALIGPKANILGGQLNIDGIDLAAIRDGTKHFYFWGLVRYNDVFDGTDEHITTFCRYITHVVGDPLRRPSQDNPVGFFFAIHDIYNSSD
jgi:hypothetical protein